PLVLARYDETAHVWTVVKVGIASDSAGTLSLPESLPGPGQYAFLVADTSVTAPPSAAPGQPLTAGPSADPVGLTPGTASATCNPGTALMSSTAASTISVVATGPTKLPSGVFIEVTFKETYNLLNASSPLLVDRPSEDFVLYSYPAATAAQPNNLAASFIAKPTRSDFTVAQLKTANVHIVIRSGRQANTGSPT